MSGVYREVFCGPCGAFREWDVGLNGHLFVRRERSCVCGGMDLDAPVHTVKPPPKKPKKSSGMVRPNPHLCDRCQADISHRDWQAKSCEPCLRIKARERSKRHYDRTQKRRAA